MTKLKLRRRKLETKAKQIAVVIMGQDRLDFDSFQGFFIEVYDEKWNYNEHLDNEFIL